MTRRKTIHELRREIMASPRLKAQSQEAICQSLSIHQATLSRILRGQFKRASDAVVRVCKYAHISCITEQPLDEMEASLARLTALARGRSARERHALQLIRLATELLQPDPSPPAAPARVRGRSVPPA